MTKQPRRRQGADQLGRLETVRERRWLTVSFLLLHPLLAWIASGLVSADGTPGIVLTTGLSLALLLSVGPRFGAAVLAAEVVTGWLVGGADLLDGTTAGTLVAESVVTTIVLVLVAVLLESRFRAIGRIRTLRWVVELSVWGALVGPAVLVLGCAAVVSATGAETPAAATLVQTALALGIGVLVLTPGARVLIMRDPVRLEDGDTAIVVGGVVASVVLLVATAIATEGRGLVSAQPAALPVLLVGFLAGSAVYSVAVAGAAVVVALVVTLYGIDATAITIAQHLSWWAVAVTGLLLSVEGDRRRRATRKLATLFGHAVAPSAEVATDGRVLQVNRAFAAMLGWRPEELVDSDLLMLFASDGDGAGIESLIAGHRDEVRGQAQVRTRGGQSRLVRYTGRRVEDYGTPDGTLIVQLLDMTDEERRAAHLQRSNDALERLGNRISHDLKQPLAAIAGYASTLRVQRDRLDADTVDEMLDRLDMAARRVVDQLDSMVESARVGGDAFESSSLSEIVAAVTGLVEIELREASGRIETSFAIETVRTDPRALQQVLLNLITNALKYHDRALPPRVRISSRARGDGVEITMTDNGPGIGHEMLEAVFEPGRRLDPNAAAGRGMGLADSRRVAEDLGGWLRAEPSPAGARFVLWLPETGTRRDPAPVRAVVVDRGDQEGGFGIAGGGPVSPLDVHHQRIEVVGRSRSIADGVSLVASLEPDVVLIDRWTADGDGLTGLAALGTAHPEARLVVRTRDGSQESVRAALLSGATRALDNGADGRAVADVIVRVAG